MQVIVAGLVLALAGQVAPDSRYTTTPNPSVEQPASAAAAPAATEAPAAASQITIPSSQPPGAGTSPQPPLTTADVGAMQAIAAPTVAQPYEIQTPPTAQETENSAATANDGVAETSVLANQGPKPSQVMRALMQAPANDELDGTALTLSDAVRDARSRQDQTMRATAYWDLSAAVADYYLALVEQSELSILQEGLTAPGNHWQVHLQQAQTRVEATRRAAVAAQLKLHQLLGRPAAAPLPLPGDIPHCGRYNAEYEEIFAKRPDAVARELSELMPLRYQQLRAQAQEIVEAEEWRNQARQRWTSASDDAQLLNAQDLVSLKRRTFIATARAYNQEIAAYTELAAPAQVAPDRLVAMMIRTSATTGAQFRSPGDVEQASAVNRGQADQAVQPAGGAPATFAEESRTEVRKPVGRIFDNRERSILSRIRRLPQRILDRN